MRKTTDKKACNCFTTPFLIIEVIVMIWSQKLLRKKSVVFCGKVFEKDEVTVKWTFDWEGGHMKWTLDL